MDEQPEQSRGFKAADPDLRPSFYKIMFPPNLVDIRIPPAFNKHIEGEQAVRVTLNTPCGSWKVTQLKHEGNVYLTQGWEKFANHHHLGDLECLVFKYNGQMCFDVDIYEQTGWKRIYGKPASSFASSNPYFEYKINRYNVGSKSTLIIPKDFASEHFRFTELTHVVMRTVEEISWPVSVIISKTKQTILSGGWKDFSDGNALRKGDTCIFELIEEHVMKVHIFRST